jgi:hypothetical protein
MKTLRPAIVVRLRSANRPSSSGRVHGTRIHGVGCGCRLGRQTTYVQRFAPHWIALSEAVAPHNSRDHIPRGAVRHRSPSNEAVFEPAHHAVRCPTAP